MRLASYHNHSRWSDGKATAAEMIESAAAQGLDEVGLSDHFVLHPEGRRYAWSMAPERLAAYVDEIRGLARGAAATVRLGLEVDFFSGHTEALRQALDGYGFDYLVGSVHEVDGLVIDGSSEPWQRLDGAERDQVHRRYWQLLAEMAGSGLFDVAAHLDLPKKFGFLPSIDLGAEIDAAVDALAAAGTVVELNTAGWHKPCADAYPSLDILRRCRARGIPVTLSADAHQPEHLVRDFERGAERLRAAGYDAIVRLDGRRTCVRLS